MMVLDTETGGTNPKNDALCEIAFVVIDDRMNELHRYEAIVAPHYVQYGDEPCEVRLGEYKERAMEVNGISMDEIEKGESYCVVAEETAFSLISLDVLHVIGHNIAFDIRFVNAMLRSEEYQISIAPICTLKIAKKWAKEKDVEIESFSLTGLCKHFGIVNNNPHRAMGDVEATLELYKKLKELGVE